MSIVSQIYRYPVKGLSAEPLTRAELEVGRGVPLDRAFALALSTVAANPGHWHSKSNFATLVEHERLAALETDYESASGVLTVRRGGKIVARGALATPVGRATVEEFFRAFLKNAVTFPPRIVGGADVAMLSDHPDPALSIIGLASIADIERVVGMPVDPLRFRANVYLANTVPWEEFAWIGRDIRLGGARLRVTERITRCAATNVEPGSGIRDLTIPRSLRAAFGHADCGVLATVTTAGSFSVGDPAGPTDD